MTDWPFDELIPHHYRCILADPPWAFTTYSAKGDKKSPAQHYACQSMEDIMRLPVRELADPSGCALMLWATSPLLNRQIETLERWGFHYKGAGAWGKRSKTGKKWAFGTGYIQRSAAEFWLIGTIGNPKRTSRSVRNFIEAPVREHSRKPDQMRRDCEILWPGPRCELFARERAEGWSAFGNEVGKFSPEDLFMQAA